jgi:hypothetical protein
MENAMFFLNTLAPIGKARVYNDLYNYVCIGSSLLCAEKLPKNKKLGATCDCYNLNQARTLLSVLPDPIPVLGPGPDP